MKILHYVHALDYGGIQRHVVRLLETIPQSDCQMDVCCRTRNFGVWAKRVEDLGRKLFYCPFGPDHLIFALRLSKLLRRGRYDILHWHIAPYAGFAVFLANLLGIKVVVSLHNTEFPSENKLLGRRPLKWLREKYVNKSLNYAVQHADAIVGVSKGALDAATLNHPGSHDRFSVILHGVDPTIVSTNLDKIAFRRSLGLQEDAFLVCHVGRLDPQKNHVGLIEIFSRIGQNASDARLIMVGDGPLRNKIEDLVSETKLNDNVLFLGFRDDAAAILALCDVLLFPSIWEGFGIVVLEAAMGGVPTVGSNIPGLTEAVVDGETGILCDVDDYSGMAAAVVKMYNNREFLRMLGAAARERVLKDFSLEKQCQAHLKLYESLIKKT